MGSGTAVMSGAHNRAKALRAMDARELLKEKLPEVLKQMSNSQVTQVQKVLDAAVVNPAVQQEYADAMRRSVVKEGRPGGEYQGGYENGAAVVRDMKLVRRANHIFEQQIPISESDKRVRIDYEKLFTANAFSLATNNPDEAVFMDSLQKTIAERGVWLRFEPKRVRDPEDPSRWILDPRTFDAWLSLGPGGDQIPTKTGIIDRAALLDTQVIGASYQNRVNEGPYMRQLEAAMKKLFNQIQDGQQENLRQDGVRALAAPLVPQISDLVGGADFPDPKMWDKAFELYQYTWKLRLQGNVIGAMQMLMCAAALTEYFARKLDDYINNTVKGAATVVKVAVVVATVAAIIDSVMLVHSIGTAIVRRWAMRAASTEMRMAARKGLASEAAPPYKGAEAYQRTHYAGPEAASNRTIAAKKFDPKATQVSDAGVGDFINVEEADWMRRGEGWKNDMFDWLIKNPDAPLTEKIAKNDFFCNKWGFHPHYY